MNTNLKQRIQVAVPGVALLLGLILFAGTFGAVIISAVISVMMIYEFSRIVFSLPDQKEKRNLLMGLSWLLSFSIFWIPSTEFGLLVTFFLILTTYFLYTSERFNGEELRAHFQEFMAAFFGLFYLGFLTTFLIGLRQASQGKHWTVLFFFLVWAMDTGGYFAGLKFGKKKLFPHISPKKTWEGWYGGVLAAVLVTVLYKLIFFKSLSWFAVFAVPCLIAVVEPIGDLAESFLKRAYDKKDSGQLLPGHGGFLDRFDGVVLSLPVMYAATRIFGVLD